MSYATQPTRSALRHSAHDIIVPLRCPQMTDSPLGVGPALKKQLGDGAAFQGVDYPADFGGNAAQTGNNPGVQPMIDDVNQALQKCPDTQVVLSGYSQGGIVTHGAMQKLPGGKVKAIVIFGDPLVSHVVTTTPSTPC